MGAGCKSVPVMRGVQKFRPNPRLKLLDQVREVMRFHHYSLRTEQAYCGWIVRFLRFCRERGGVWRHPKEMGAREVERFLSWLASEGKVAAATQKQALNALVFLYRQVLDVDLGNSIRPRRADKAARPPVVMTREETQAVLGQMEGTHGLMARLMYGSGLRLMECVRLRVRDVDLGQGRIYVREGKGAKDRTTCLPESVEGALGEQLKRVRALHEEDVADGFGAVWVPEALGRKYPRAAGEFGWRYLFPAHKRSRDPRSGMERRHHVMESGLQKAVKAAAQRAGLAKKVTCHTLRHSFATHVLEAGTNIRVLQELLGHADVKTTEIYTHVIQREAAGLRSPLDGLVQG